MLARKSIIQALGLATATFPNYPATKEMIDSYSLLLGDLEVSEDQLMTAMANVLKSQPFFPTVYSIRAELVSSLFVLAPSSAEAWREILEMRDYRRDKIHNLQFIASGSVEWNQYKDSLDWRRAFNPRWSHKAIADTIETLGGWSEVYSVIDKNEGISTFRSQLWKIYKEYSEAEDRNVYLGRTQTRKELA